MDLVLGMRFEPSEISVILLSLTSPFGVSRSTLRLLGNYIGLLMIAPAYGATGE